MIKTDRRIKKRWQLFFYFTWTVFIGLEELINKEYRESADQLSDKHD